MVGRFAVRACALLALLAIAASGAAADQVTLKDGRKYEGKVVQETVQEVGIELLNGSVIHVPRADVQTIERGKSLAEEVQDRLAALDPADPAAYVDLGTFCLGQKPLLDTGRRCLWCAAWLDPGRYGDLVVRIADSLTHPREKGLAWHLYRRAELSDPHDGTARARVEGYPADHRAAAGDGDPLSPPLAKGEAPPGEPSLAEQTTQRLRRAGSRLYGEDLLAGRVVCLGGKWITPQEKAAALSLPPAVPAPPDGWTEALERAVELPPALGGDRPPAGGTVFRTAFVRDDRKSVAPHWSPRGAGFSLAIPRTPGRTAAEVVRLASARGATFVLPPGWTPAALPATAELVVCYRVTQTAAWVEAAPERDLLVTLAWIEPVGFELRESPGGKPLLRWR